MAKIRQLDSTVYNQISAGEVVENPASIIKELIENSLDAGANFITVSVEDGGIKTISVSDDGCGMDSDDIRLCFLPHATSKIFTAADLDTVSTLGFRGEAMPSIAAVSSIEIHSRAAGSETCSCVHFKGGKEISSCETVREIGTSITVSNLFWNVPARFKFLKTKKGEEAQVTKLMTGLILSNPSVGFSYVSDGKSIFYSDGNGLHSALFAVMDADVANNMLPIELSSRGYSIKGYVARPSTSAIKSNKSDQYFIVNGRLIDEDAISASCQNAYGERLMRRNFPTLVLDFTVPFNLVDVNVHPNKREVRFADKAAVTGLAYHAIKNAVENDENERRNAIFSAVFPQKDKNQTEFMIEVGESIDKKIVDEKLNTETHFETKFKRTTGIEVTEKEEFPIGFLTKKSMNDAVKRADYKDNTANFRTAAMLLCDSEESIESDSTLKYGGSILDRVSRSDYTVIGQAFNTYLLVEHSGSILIIDQHAAHERILFDNLLKIGEKNALSQELMIPFETKIDIENAAKIERLIKPLKKFGFDLKIKEDTVYLHSVPAILTDLDISGFLFELSEGFAETAEFTAEYNVIKEKIAKIACKNAIKGGLRLDNSQISYILNYFFDNNMPMQCPHGRPTLTVITRSELEKMFARRN